MIRIEEALDILARETVETAVETVCLEEAWGRTLAESVAADRDDPAFDRSAMDGFAFSVAPVLNHPYPRVGTIAAGDEPLREQIPADSCMAIMTGAPVPKGTNRIIPVEDVLSEEGAVRVQCTGRSGGHIRRQGEVVQAGAPVLSPGTVLNGERMGVLAGVGVTAVPVFRKPRVRVCSTGDELVPVHVNPGPGQIRDSNRWALAGLLYEWGAQVQQGDTLRDEAEGIRKTLRGDSEWDILVLTGGVSMGEFDWVDRILREEGVRTVFHKVAIKPGKPIYVGRMRSGKWVFGLPGNPVSVCVTARLFLRGVIFRAQGIRAAAPVALHAVAGEGLPPASGRDAFLPGRLRVEDGKLVARVFQTTGSGDLVHHAQSNCLIYRRAGDPGIGEGDEVAVWVTSGRWGGNDETEEGSA